MSVRALEKTEIKSRWAEFAPRFQRALDHDPFGMKANDIMTGVLDGDMIVLELDETIMAVEIKGSYGERIANIAAFEGEDGLQCFHAYDDILTALALEQRCDQLMLQGRKGWRRALKSWGWVEASTTLTKRIN
jgi:hypothetical protein